MVTPSVAATTDHESSDVFQRSDKQLSEKYRFIEECGAGNYGSVWIAKDKKSPPGLNDEKIAIKVVHRSKTQTTAARVRSLWNEMKIIKPLKADLHPSIINFYSFIITPSYALITMEYLPKLIPVEVDESLAREWFRCLAGAVEYLHERGVVHNDIKPANILLSNRGVPVFVDFGFAEKYDRDAENAFLSTLAYGTPEYLSPERARGLCHDTRKADIWSLGVTMFEILVGRTPFEEVEGEQFQTKEDLERYWQRTLKGKWLGTWRFSRDAEKLLKKMICPNADLRITATHIMLDPYFNPSPGASLSRQSLLVPATPTRTVSATTELVQKSSGPSATVARPGKERDTTVNYPTPIKHQALAPPSIAIKPPQTPLRNRILEPLKEVDTPESSRRRRTSQIQRKVASPSSRAKENMVPGTAVSQSSRKPARKPLPSFFNAPNMASSSAPSMVGPRTPNKRPAQTDAKDENGAKTTRRKSFGKALADLTPLNGRKRGNAPLSKIKSPPSGASTPDVSAAFMDSTTVSPSDDSPQSLFLNDTFPRVKNGSGLSIMKHVRKSVDKTVGKLGKGSSVGRLSNAGSVVGEPQQERSASVSARESWEDDTMMRNAKSSLPVVRHAIRDEQISADNQLDRMTIWIQNVEKVVEDAKKNFARNSLTPLPPLPPRISPSPGPYRRNTNTSEKDLTTPLPQGRRQRRATVSSTAPPSSFSPLENDFPDISSELSSSPRRHKAKAKSQSDIMNMTSRPITPVAKLQYDLQHPEEKKPVRLSEVVDEAARKLFFTEPSAPPRLESFSTIPPPEITVTETPLRAPAPQRESPTHKPFASSIASSSMNSMRDRQTQTLNSSSVTPAGSLRAPSFSNIDAEINAGLYEKFLLATANVKRVGGGYQFTDPDAPPSGAREFPSIQNKSVIGFAGGKKRKSFNANSKAESNARRQALLADSRRRSSCSADDFGVSCAPAPMFVTPIKSAKSGPGSFMRKALKVISVGSALKPSSKRLSQAY